jgi:hypothetical protein
MTCVCLPNRANPACPKHKEPKSRDKYVEAMIYRGKNWVERRSKGRKEAGIIGDWADPGFREVRSWRSSNEECRRD